MVTKLRAEQLAAAEQQVAEVCRAAGIYAVVGTAWRAKLVVSPANKVIERYHHLSVFQINGVPCSVIICHDERYPELDEWETPRLCPGLYP